MTVPYNAAALRSQGPTLLLPLLVVTLLALSPLHRAYAAESADSALPEDFAEQYRISPEDVLDISVWEEPELQQKVTVRPDGGITMPLIGSIEAAGLTTSELQNALRDELTRFIPDPVISVSVADIRGLKIYVSGRVGKPGEYRVGRYVDVLQALSLAGGLTPFAKQREIRILRRGANGTDMFDFNYDQVRRGRNMEQNIVLQPGDTVIVP